MVFLCASDRLGTCGVGAALLNSSGGNIELHGYFWKPAEDEPKIFFSTCCN